MVRRPMTIATFKKRIEKLERHRAPVQETEASQKLRARLAAACRRMRQFSSEENHPLPPLPAETFCGMTLDEIIRLHLQRGRERNHRARGKS